MAEQMNDFSFTQNSGYKYPWSQWGDGTVWRCVKGTDFDVKSSSFAQAVYKAAARAGKKARITFVGDGTDVVFQFIEKLEEGGPA